jgi:hypothetical protein
MRRAAFLALLLLASCGEGSDAHKFERKEFDRPQPAITIVTHPTLADLRAKAPASATADKGRELQAWSIIRPTSCEVHVVDPAKQWRPEWIGHEVAHCAWGRWHR